ncbi:acyl-CoA dehydrogenase family protein [Mycobacterium sp. Aquia_213]|uniref:acyl-CoA dehydrogenase family protein n=1 Tax=Mycobacterium sp. Aquia_213 TaxID=2991728 RepID=UPI00226FA68E|nr:acyl-CoA dehydrogenase family protein [Mycobacterium sp. Aquia_213]WAC90148.1 acyl-CoA dehydrogenase family protein [Mycobacterium sp. Aquia_213]
MTNPQPTTTESSTAGATETVAEFRKRARTWLAANMARAPKNPADLPIHRDEDASWARARELQGMLFDGGFAGICFPREYGGLGLDYAYQKAFDAESEGYELPLILNAPSFAICCATLLDTGSEEQKKAHIGAALRGEEVLVQLLSEPSGGSDLAGVITRADRKDGKWVLNGAKIWSSGAFAADYGLCLARSNWDVPKHEGLTMFLVPINHPGITLRRIKQVNGSLEFCEEFFDNVELGDDAVVGGVDDGWAVASRQLFHERRAVGKGSEFCSGIGIENFDSKPADLVDLVNQTGQAGSERARELAGRALVHRAVRDHLAEHVYHAVLDGSLPQAGGSLLRLCLGLTASLVSDIALTIAGTAGVVGTSPEAFTVGERYLSRQGDSIGGGTTEIARNIIGERILNFPREYAADRGVPFNEVHKNRAK